MLFFSMIDITPTPMIDVTPPPPTPQTKKASNGRRHNDKYLYFSLGVLSYSIHIQFFSQNQSLLSSLQNQIIIKRVDRIKLNSLDDNSNGDDTTAKQVEDKDGYYK